MSTAPLLSPEAVAGDRHRAGAVGIRRVVHRHASLRRCVVELSADSAGTLSARSIESRVRLAGALGWDPRGRRTTREVAVAELKHLLVRSAVPLLRPANRLAVRRRYRRAARSAPSTAPMPQHKGPVVMCFPHVDDETIAAGGLLLAWKSLGTAVDLVYLTDSSAGGAGASSSERASARRAEAMELARRTGVRSVRVLSGVNESLAETAPRVIQELTDVLTQGSYEAIVTAGPLDAHHEHRECAALVAEALTRAAFDGPVYVGENSNLLPCQLVTHHVALTRECATERAALFDVFRSQTTMGFEVYSDLARAKAALVPEAYAVELFHRTDAAGFSRLVDAAAAAGIGHLLRHRIGNSWSLWRALGSDPEVMAALQASERSSA